MFLSWFWLYFALKYVNFRPSAMVAHTRDVSRLKHKCLSFETRVWNERRLSNERRPSTWLPKHSPTHLTHILVIICIQNDGFYELHALVVSAECLRQALGPRSGNGELTNAGSQPPNRNQVTPEHRPPKMNWYVSNKMAAPMQVSKMMTSDQTIGWGLDPLTGSEV